LINLLFQTQTRSNSRLVHVDKQTHVNYLMHLYSVQISRFVILFCWIWSVTHEGFNVCSVQAWLEFAQNKAEPHRQHQQNCYKFSLLWNIYMWQKSGP